MFTMQVVLRVQGHIARVAVAVKLTNNPCCHFALGALVPFGGLLYDLIWFSLESVSWSDQCEHPQLLNH